MWGCTFLTETIKICNKCGEEKPNTDEFFGKNLSRKDGLEYFCKECAKIIHDTWYQKNREKEIKRVTDWVKENREKSREYKRRWREKNQEAMKLARKNWKLAHPEKLIEYKHRQRAILRGLDEHYTEQDILDLIEESENRCFYCGIELDDFHIEHKTPLGIGGSDVKENLALSCADCNYEKHMKTAEEYFEYRKLIGKDV